MFSRYVWAAVLLSGFAAGQASSVGSVSNFALPPSNRRPPLNYSPFLDLSTPAVSPRLAPELASRIYETRIARQAEQLSEYSAITVIRAELPDMAEAGVLETQRQYEAPRTLRFKALHYYGDGFVKTDIIERFLQAEVSQVEKADGRLTAINRSNYRFSYLKTATVGGRPAYLYSVQPRSKRPGLFKGQMYLDAFSGSLLRVEGKIIKTPSFFLKAIEFVQDYSDLGRFTFPVHLHSQLKLRILGRAVIDIYHSDYQVKPGEEGDTVAVPALVEGADSRTQNCCLK